MLCYVICSIKRCEPGRVASFGRPAWSEYLPSVGSDRRASAKSSEIMRTVLAAALLLGCALRAAHSADQLRSYRRLSREFRAEGARPESQPQPVPDWAEAWVSAAHLCPQRDDADANVTSLFIAIEPYVFGMYIGAQNFHVCDIANCWPLGPAQQSRRHVLQRDVGGTLRAQPDIQARSSTNASTRTRSPQSSGPRPSRVSDSAPRSRRCALAAAARTRNLPSPRAVLAAVNVRAADGARVPRPILLLLPPHLPAQCERLRRRRHRRPPVLRHPGV